MSIAEIEVELLNGTATTLGELAPGPVLVVNTASKCGLTPQYEGLEALFQEYGSRGLSVVGMPCNQFLKQEPGTAEEIGEFCQLNYGVTFPLLAKGKVNGKTAHPLFQALKKAKDSLGVAGPVMWNFEKFLVVPAKDGKGEQTLTRFRSAVAPEDADLRAAIERAVGEPAV